MTRRPVPLDSPCAARAGATVIGPILSLLPCGCTVDDGGGVWSPCPTIKVAHLRALALVREGPRLRAGDYPRDEHGRRLPPDDLLADLLAIIAAHVAAGERAAHGVGSGQGALL